MVMDKVVRLRIASMVANGRSPGARSPQKGQEPCLEAVERVH